MATKLGKILADFTTSLATALAVGGTSATLQSATDDDGVALPSGTYYFALDGGTSNKEHIQCQLSGTSITSIYSVSRQGTLTSGVVRKHRVGCSVALTDFAYIMYMQDLLAGTTDLNSSVPLKYDGTATISNANHLATKAYVDGVAIAGAPDASTTVKGIAKMSVAPASATNPIAVGDNDTRVPTANEKTILTALLTSVDWYAATSSGTDAYAITVSPAIGAYATGQRFRFKADVANTGAATLNVSGLGAKTLKKTDGTSDLATGDILAGSIVEVVYDGTNFQVISSLASTSPVDIQVFTSSGTWTKPSSALAVDVYVVGAGGGGGSGSRRPTIGEMSGGGGGGGGAYSCKRFLAQALAATETVTVGTGGSGGAAQTSNGTSGNAGSAGGASSFGTSTLVIADGGGAGGGGGTSSGGSAGTGASTRNGDIVFAGGNGGAGGNGSAGGQGADIATGSGARGGGGGATRSAGTGFAGGAGGAFITNYVKAGGAGGTSSGGVGTAGSSTDAGFFFGGVGGGGGGQSNAEVVGYAGGAGGFPGGGGGGGTGSQDGNNSGAGGAGGGGMVVVVTYK